MEKTISELSPNERNNYKLQKAIENRSRQNRDLIEKRSQNAWKIARKAAEILKINFAAQQVWVFGSLAHPPGMNPWSDIDLAVRGIPKDKFYAAVAALIDLTADFKIDLIDMDSCKQQMQEIILHQGLEL